MKDKEKKTYKFWIFLSPKKEPSFRVVMEFLFSFNTCKLSNPRNERLSMMLSLFRDISLEVGRERREKKKKKGKVL